MDPKPRYKYLVFDLETSGLPEKDGFNFFPSKQYQKYDSCRIIELGYILYDENKKLVKEVSHLVKPEGFEISEASEQVHGIPQQRLEKEGLSIEEVLLELEWDLYDAEILIAHHMDFDYHVLLAEIYRQKNNGFIQMLIKKKKHCTLRLAQKALPNLENHKLGFLYKFLFEKEVSIAHRALQDCQNCGEIYFKLMEEFSDSLKLQMNVPDQQYVVQFGKHKGQTVQDIIDQDFTYCFYVMKKDFKCGDFYELQGKLFRLLKQYTVKQNILPTF